MYDEAIKFDPKDSNFTIIKVLIILKYEGISLKKLRKITKPTIMS